MATEQQSLDQILQGLVRQKQWAEMIFARLSGVRTIPDCARVLDVGAGTGGFLVACTQLGHRCEGVEPWEEARLNAKKLSEHLPMPINVVDGTAESIPYCSDSFDVVHASSVIEHVLDVERAFKEIYRVLKSGGVFWFNTASSMCPMQREIQGFPLFGWYPDSLKRRIMSWASEAKPHLVGYTKTPAINWFTSKKASNLLRRTGFNQVYDRWELRREYEGGKAYGLALRLIRSSRLSKALANIVVPDCAFAAIK